MSAKTRRSHTEAFKEEEVRLVRESRHPEAQVALDLGIADHLSLPVANGAAGSEAWTDPTLNTGRAGGTGSAARENSVLKQERDFLREADAFFARAPT
jgi:transposase